MFYVLLKINTKLISYNLRWQCSIFSGHSIYLKVRFFVLIWWSHILEMSFQSEIPRINLEVDLKQRDWSRDQVWNFLQPLTSMLWWNSQIHMHACFRGMSQLVFGILQGAYKKSKPRQWSVRGSMPSFTLPSFSLLEQRQYKQRHYMTAV